MYICLASCQENIARANVKSLILVLLSVLVI